VFEQQAPIHFRSKRPPRKSRRVITFSEFLVWRFEEREHPPPPLQWGIKGGGVKSASRSGLVCLPAHSTQAPGATWSGRDDHLGATCPPRRGPPRRGQHHPGPRRARSHGERAARVIHAKPTCPHTPIYLYCIWGTSPPFRPPPPPSLIPFVLDVALSPSQRSGRSGGALSG
jgi:hypothetical protein